MPIVVRANPSRVTWNHFRPVASIPGTTEAAQINAEMAEIKNVHPQRTKEGRFRLPSLTLTVGLNRHNTLVLQKANKTAELLKHEQGHFDILVLVTRALARELESLEADSPQDLGDLLQEARDRHRDRADTIDEAYDDETEHSRERRAQAKWDIAIAAALSDTKASKISGMEL
jgi:predicted secreted Zn-dependent protease